MSQSAALLQSAQPDLPDIDTRQRMASDPTVSVWVDASAGSGKTKVLTDRVIRLLLSGVRPEKILCLTFTKAAAAEMAIRVNKQLAKWATCDDETLGADIQKLQGEPASSPQMIAARKLFARVLTAAGGLRINTIHAFCLEILRRFPIEAGLSPQFRPLDDREAATLSERAYDDLLTEAGQNPEGDLGKDLALLVRHLGEHKLADELRAAAKVRLAEISITDVYIRLCVTPAETPESIEAMMIAPATLPQAELHDLVMHLLQEKSKSFVATGIDLKTWLDQQGSSRKLDKYLMIFFTREGEPRKKIISVGLAKAQPHLQVFIDRETLRLKKLLEKHEAAVIAASTMAALRLGADLNKRYAAHKTALATLDYDDQIQRVRDLFRKPDIAPWILFKLDRGLDHILIDEAQDTSRAQWDIVDALSDEFFAGESAGGPAQRTIFVVGDLKQSIFSFQNADPIAFAEMREKFDSRLKALGQELRFVDLNVSFRSSPVVLQAVDSVFSRPEAWHGVSAHPVYHQPYHVNRAGRVELWPLMVEDKCDNDLDEAWTPASSYEATPNPQAALADKIAERIRDWLRAGVLVETDRGVRAMVPGDVMILLRRRGLFASLMVRALKKRGVPVAGVDRMKLMQQLPVKDLLAMLNFMLLPEDDLTLAVILRGPLIGFSEEQLMAVAIGREGSLWRSLQTRAAHDPACGAAHDYLAAQLAAADYRTPFDALSDILSKPCPASTISGRHAIWQRLGVEALDPIDELLNAAQDFGLNTSLGLQAFLHQVARDDTEIKREMDQNKDKGPGEVRIMTVHASKGLEAPIVFLPDTTGLPRATDLPSWQIDNDVPLYLPRKPGVDAARTVWDSARARQIEEYRRLLYVALTRASQRLVIAGWEARNESKDFTSWYNLVREACANLGLEPETDGALVLAGGIETEATVLPIEKIMKENVALPDWALSPPPPEPNSPRLITPSRQAESSGAASPNRMFVRGLVIHKLLQILPEIEAGRRQTVAQRYIAGRDQGLSVDEQVEIVDEVFAILDHSDYAPLFDADSRAEVPLIGRFEDEVIAGQVDRLRVTEDEVWIVDYKTNRPPPDDPAKVPVAYRKQMSAYARVLADIYKGKAVRTFLLWTYLPRLVEI